MINTMSRYGSLVPHFTSENESTITAFIIAFQLQIVSDICQRKANLSAVVFLHLNVLSKLHFQKY